MHRSHLLLAMLTLALSAAPGFAEMLVLDPLTDELPPNECLVATRAPVLFTTRYCDGDACPPALLVEACTPMWNTYLRQTDLPGLGAGVRRLTRLYEMPGGNTEPEQGSWARILPAQGAVRLECRTGRCFSTLSFTYDRSPRWNLDLEALGMPSLRIAVTGDMTEETPLGCYVLLEDFGDGVGQEKMATLTRSVTQPGEFIMRLAEFDMDPGFDFHDIDWIVVKFGNCSVAGCTNSRPTPNFTASKFQFDTADAVPVQRSTWGSLKVHAN